MSEEEKRSQELANALAAHIAKGIVEGFLDAERAKVAKQYEERIKELEGHNAALERTASAMQEHIQLLEETNSVQESQMVTLRNSVSKWRDKYDKARHELDDANAKVATVMGWQLGENALSDLERRLHDAEQKRDVAAKYSLWYAGELEKARERIIKLERAANEKV